uniref:L1 transposable element RRM domain-containing protein n=1 Tax=Sphaeramia orbicularis TaxID=375764 RepID=A0A672Y8S3_9TELE
MLAELRTLRKEHAEASKDTKESLTRVETALSEVTERTTQLESRLTEYEERLAAAEEKSQRSERALRYLLYRDASISAKCEDLESRARRNNLRIYGVKEDEENNSNMIDFISDLIRTSLTLPGDLNLNIVRAHRSLTMKPKNPESPPRSIIVRFLDYRTKERVIQEAWKHRGGTTYKEQKIFFDQDYTVDTQRKRKQVRDVIKRLKEKNIKAQSPFPAKLKLHLESGVKTFTSLADAAETLEGLETHLNQNEHLKLRREWVKL